MMKTWFRLALFLAAFQMEVRVRAAGGTEILSEPPHCVGVSVPCAFKVPEVPWSFNSGKIKISATPGSLLTEQVRGQVWSLSEGSLWVKNGPSVKIKTVTAETATDGGEYWVLAEKDQVVFRNISAQLVLTLKDQTKLEIPRGFEVWVGAVDADARVMHGMIEPIHLQEHLKVWFSLYPGSKSLFLSEVQDLKDQWVDRTEQSGDIYQRIIERKLAAIERERQRASEERLKKQKAASASREQFYKKVFEQ
jgi:hypothetical protein